MFAPFAVDVFDSELGVPLHMAQAEGEFVVIGHFELVELAVVWGALAHYPIGGRVGACVFGVHGGHPVAQFVGVQVASVIPVGASGEAGLAVAEHIQFHGKSRRQGDLFHVVVAVDAHAGSYRQAFVAHFVLDIERP